MKKKTTMLLVMSMLILSSSISVADTLIPLELGMPFGIVAYISANVYQNNSDREVIDQLPEGYIVQLLGVSNGYCNVFYFDDDGHQKLGYISSQSLKQLTLAGLIHEAETPEKAAYLQSFLGVGIPYYIKLQVPENSEENDDDESITKDGLTIAVDPPSYILNKNTKKFHLPSCGSINDIHGKNFEAFYGTKEEALALGYKPCKSCNP